MSFVLPPRVPNGRTIADFCCKEGGASFGYYLAGFDVVGFDREPQPRYPFPFVQTDLREIDPEWLRQNFDGAAGSPPCWAHSDLAHRTGREYEDFIPETRELFEASGLPYVMENVEGAPLRTPLTLCGTMFEGLRVSRHRLFESNVLLTAPRPCPKRHPLHFTHDKRKAHYGQLDEWSAFVTVTGGGNSSKAAAEDAMGIPAGWMTKDGLNQAIPPAYTEWIGRQLAEHIVAERTVTGVPA
ncbi:DNA cytosine methyltransferase [Streptomyces sp. WAC 01529]|uniref:DNA cytosine methyltransferase n=1 Tax=Streptomyces sp. WAC 01529 TaxID=2203205 RepID=UPI0019D11539|nr:DNA cytosine methyltransferase [Streptomyces sp. WAC 01529]